ncbi:hypothetical protein ACI2KC_08455 [Pseudomonas monteilii]|jgi:hypothetical protein|uniref:hypothetical protein n=2 Tax=Pseudomonas alabamensis TaxID=3064349 RepID=UPI000745BB3B|nr:hypothetical protein [Pseudomonas sp. 22-AL-CL-001]AMA45438.1 hypothetical protein APT63_07220 [Pseudomonas monteilii]MDO7909508.1 hypothetical protein [Pseudomonas sp. 22-AL-CL-001]
MFRKMMGTMVVAAMIGVQGCASIVGESRYPVVVSSAPPGAAFEITDKNGTVVHTGNTPSTVTLKSGKGYFTGQTYTLRFKKDGYPDRTVELDSSLSGWYWGNILVGGLIGMLIVDPLTGAMYKLPEYASADMGQPLVNAKPDTLKVGVIDDLSAAQREQLVPVQ